MQLGNENHSSLDEDNGMAHIAPRILLLAQEVEEEDRKEATFGRLVDPRSFARPSVRPFIEGCSRSQAAA